jgi:hypothetical protein
MENQPSHDELRRAHRAKLHTELARRGLPRAYIERLVAELDDHLTDLLEERSSPMGAARKLQIEADNLQQRFGDPAQLAVFAAEEYHSRTFWGRHPLVTFLFAPLPLLIAMWMAYVFTVWLVVALPAAFGVWLTGWSIPVEDHPYLQAFSLTMFTWGLYVAPPLAAAVLLCRTYRRNALNIRWPMLGCTLLALVAAIIHFSWRLKTGSSEAEMGIFMFGFDVGSSPRSFLLTYLPKFAVALGIGFLLIKHAQRQLDAENA